MTRADVDIASPILKAQMDLAVFCACWRARAEEWDRFGLSGSAAAIVGQLLADLDVLLKEQAELRLNVREAALVRDVTERTIGRWLEAERLVNYGVPHAPRVRLGDLVADALKRSELSDTTSVEAEAA
jgi:hypothetical protein